MNIEEVLANKLIPYVNNTRTHSEEQVTQIAASIREFGFNNPIL
jgi:ParB-like chromosome segregation protein Spo0J